MPERHRVEDRQARSDERAERSRQAVDPAAPRAVPDVKLLQRRALGNRGALRAARLIQRQCRECQEEEPELQRKPQDQEAEGIQTKPAEASAAGPGLTLSQPGDRYEQEADRVAEHVVQRLALPSAPAQQPGGAVPDLQRACAGCQIAAPSAAELEEDKVAGDDAPAVSRKAEVSGAAASHETSRSSFESSLGRSRGAGRPLPLPVRRQMEEGFGQDFGGVRIHTGSSSAAMNRSIHAQAFTHQNNIFFNEGMYEPGTERGRLLLAHELTHVIQQTGSQPAPATIQRAAEMKIGNWAHSQIQERLRGKDKELITEAPIPGGTRDGKKHNSVGFADLYKADGQVMSGISAQEPRASKDAPEQPSFYKYVNMRSNYKDRADSRSIVEFGPKIINHKKNRWDFNPTFPSNFHIGEIKPLFASDFKLSAASLGAGISQEGNYREGFEAFAARAYQDNPAHQAHLPATISGQPLKLGPSKIPDAINYRKFETERLTQGKGAILKKDTNQRIWIYELKDGVVFYFLVREPYTSEEFPKRVERQLGRLDPLLKRLRKQQAKASNKLMPRLQDSAPRPQTVTVPVSRRSAAPRVQRKKDWAKAQKDWETDRKNWVKGKTTGAGAGAAVDKPKDFLKGEAQGVEKKARVDKKLGLRSTGKLGEQVQQVRSVRFWSGYKGRILGALRFRLGHVFDKVAAFFEGVKAKFREHRAGSDKLVEKRGIFSGWKKEATRAIIGFAVEIFKEMLVQAFRGFIDCINGVVSAILGKFTYAVDEAKEELAEEVEPLCCQIIDFKKQLEEEYQQHERTIAEFTEAVETIREWRDILTTVEVAIRAGVQIVSCGTPPALGCLWGLVAQLGLSASLKLLARTDYFEDEIARPAARRLMGAIVGDSLHNLLIEQLEKTPLKPFLDEAQDCQRRRSVAGRTSIGGNLHKLDPNDPQIVKARKEWEKEFGPQILADLQRVFQKGKGQKPTREDLQKLIDLMHKSGKTPEQIKALLEAARDPSSGKLDLAKASANVEQGELPEGQPKERDINYEKAQRVNLQLQEALGWKPETFYPKPGVDPGSVEFANAVYDMQEALDVKADGILGENTLIAFYKRNKLEKDAAYQEAQRRRREKQAAKDKARREREEKERQAAEEKAAEEKAAEEEQQAESGGSKNLMAIPVTRPPAGTRIVEYGDLNDELHSSPGWISSPYGEVTPALGGDKTAYQAGERLKLDVVYWNKKVKKWVWFTHIQVEFKSMSSLNENRTLTYRQREDFYFKLTADSDYVFREKKGTFVIYIDKGGLL